MRKPYPADLTDEQWALVEPLIPTSKVGRPRTNDRREVVNAILYLNDSSKWPLQAVLRTYVTGGAQLADSTVSEQSQYNAPHSTQMAVVVLATLPIVLVYPFLQRFFVKGVLTGAVKG